MIGSLIINKLKAGNTLDASGFPTVLPEELFDVWLEYCNTQTAFELFNQKPGLEGVAMAQLGFLSYVANLTSTPLPVSPFKESAHLVGQSVRAEAKKFKQFLQQRDMASHLKLSDMKLKVDLDVNKVVNAAAPIKATIFFAYTARAQASSYVKDFKVRFGKTSVGKMVHEKEKYWFPQGIPKSVAPSNNLTKKLKTSPVANLPEPFPTFSSLIANKRYWDLLEPKLNLYVARARGDVLAFRIDFELEEVLFFERKPLSMMKTFIARLIKSAYL